ncbi:hypothetical protein [Streptomyces sp. SID8352]|uniref:hypothetical protein n=1 Tax=unclassified Streptomyces TaxID=2593676 RepID=UPI0013680710|nr:hypothetical protein [Streptomyces sp. SID8352]
MVIVAVLLLPGLGLLLCAMTCLEDRMFGGAGPARHARRRPLRLLPGGGDSHRAARAGREPGTRREAA